MLQRYGFNQFESKILLQKLLSCYLLEFKYEIFLNFQKSEYVKYLNLTLKKVEL